MRNKGITLVALVITIIVLLILSGVTISALSGENGIITNAIKAKKMTTLSQCKEEYEMFITEEMIKNNKFQKTSLVAGETNLIYNTQKPDETGNIYNVIPSLKNNEYNKKLEIIKGDLLLNTKDPKEIELAQSVGIQANPYDIVNGELLSSNGNLLLMDETGTLTIPDRVTKIGEGAFANVSGLKTIIIPGTVKVIGANAFSNNQTLEKIIIEDGVEKIESEAFFRCINLKEIIMPDSITQIDRGILMYCYNLKNVRLSENLKILSSYTLHDCRELEIIKIPNNIERIGDEVFYNCNKLKEIKIPAKTTYISNNAISGCTSLENIDLSDNKNFIYENGILMPKTKDDILFMSDKKLKESNIFKIPEGIKTYSKVISNYNNIDTIVLPQSLEKLENYQVSIFPTSVKNIKITEGNTNFKVINNTLYSYDEKKLILCFEKGTSVNILPTTEDIEINAFGLANNLTEIYLPDSVKNIKEFAMTYCNQLTKIKIGKNVTYISPFFKYNYTTLELTIDPSNLNYSVEDYILYNKDKTELITTLKPNSGNFIVKDTVKVIGTQAFCNERNITEIILPIGIIEIKDSFQYCTFTKIEIPSTITQISTSAFLYNPNLSQIIINKPKDSIPGAPWGAVKGNRVVEWKP